MKNSKEMIERMLETELQKLVFAGIPQLRFEKDPEIYETAEEEKLYREAVERFKNNSIIQSAILAEVEPDEFLKMFLDAYDEQEELLRERVVIALHKTFRCKN